jgi:hypothetical protein
VRQGIRHDARRPAEPPYLQSGQQPVAASLAAAAAVLAKSAITAAVRPNSFIFIAASSR